MACPVCKKGIASDHTSYVVGWCGKDVHTYPCLNTHIRKCTRCRFPNSDVIRYQDNEKLKQVEAREGDKKQGYTNGQTEGRSCPINESGEFSESEFAQESEFDGQEGEFPPSSEEFD